MATTENKYTANGSDTQFVFTFPFLSTTDIKVSLNQILTTAFTVTESVPTLITFNTAPANGVAVRIFRETNPDATLSRFFSGSSVPAPDLNNNFDQALFINQELLNEFDEFVTTGIIDNSVTTSKIADGAVVTSKLADNSVTTVKITDANVTTAKIADANVTTAKIADANVTTAKILDSNVTADKIADANVTTAKIADANVTTAKVADAAITPAKLSIDYTEEAPSNGKQYARKDDAWSEVLPTTSSGDSPPSNPTDGLIWYDSDSGKSFVYYVDTNSSQWVELSPSWTGGIADDAVTTAKIASGNVTTSTLADNSITADKIGTKTFVSYAAICDQKAYNVDGGAFTSGAWRTRDLNTELYDPDNIVTVASNQFTLTAGNYFIVFSAPAFDVNKHLAVLQDVTNSATVGIGTSEEANVTGNGYTRSSGTARIVITGTTVYEIQHQSNASKSLNGFGKSHDNNPYGSIYTRVEIYKEA